MAEHSVPLAIATNNGVRVPHAFPFAVLCGALGSGYTGLLRHVRAAHAAVREYCEGDSAYSPDSGVSPMVKGKLLETVLCIALSMKFAGMGAGSHLRRVVAGAGRRRLDPRGPKGKSPQRRVDSGPRHGTQDCG